MKCGKTDVIPLSTGPTTSFLFSDSFIKEVESKEPRMTDFLSDWYLWTKALHVISVIAWMAGLFYLPRLYVYHVESVVSGSPTDVMFQTMERRLLRGIMAPAMIATWIFGLCLVLTPGIVDWSMIWPWTKAASVLAMTWFHQWLGLRRKDFLLGNNQVTGRQFRLMNEVPTLLLLVIVFSVIVKF
jgi:protoporphyrinogen IX oxidase